MYIRVHQNSKKFSKSHAILIYFVLVCMKAISAKKNDFFCVSLAGTPKLAKTTPFSKWWPSEENAKKIIFFAEMAYTHVGTKYIKRQRDFENFWKFRCSLMSTLLKTL